MADIAPQLLEQVQQTFSENFRKNKKITELYSKIRKGNATFKDAEEFASQTGKALAAAYGSSISSAVLPDGKMYYNIAERVIGPTLAQNFALATKIAGMVQENLNEQAGIGMKAKLPDLDPDKIDGFLNRISSEDNFDDVKWILGAPVETFTQAVVDDTIQENVKLQYKSGMRPKIVRTVIGKCCDWCEALAGTYYYPDVPKDVFRRHNNCNCLVEYFPGDGRVQNAHTKQWLTVDQREKAARIELDIKRTDYFRQSGGAEVGGHHYPNNKADSTRDRQAASWYERISRTNDIDAIAQNGGVTRDEAIQIKRHVFFAKHNLYEKYGRFTPDYNMAVAWKRITEGNAKPRDLTLLQHELLESQMEKLYNLSASEAHKIATKQYDWWAQLLLETDGKGEPDGLL